MIENGSRGAAWTNAILGLKSKEIHLCGDPRGLNLIKSMANTFGDEVIYHEYKRLNPLKIHPTPFSIPKDLLPGDCIVAFRISDLEYLKKVNYHIPPFIIYMYPLISSFSFSLAIMRNYSSKKTNLHQVNKPMEK